MEPVGRVEIGTEGTTETSAVGMAETGAMGVAGGAAVGIPVSAIAPGSSRVSAIRERNMQNEGRLQQRGDINIYA